MAEEGDTCPNCVESVEAAVRLSHGLSYWGDEAQDKADVLSYLQAFGIAPDIAAWDHVKRSPSEEFEFQQRKMLRLSFSKPREARMAQVRLLRVVPVGPQPDARTVEITVKGNLYGYEAGPEVGESDTDHDEAIAMDIAAHEG